MGTRRHLAGGVAAGSIVAACAAPTPSPLADVRTGPSADPLTACTNVVAHWAGVDLAGGFDVGDYQQRGLSARQDGARRAIVAEGRAAGGLTEPRIRERARVACEELLAEDPDPSGF